MLTRLVDYAKTQGLVVEPGFTPKTVRWGIFFAQDGRFTSVIELGDPEEKNNKGEELPCCPDLSQPELVAGGVPRSHFLVDTAEVVALLGPKADEPKNRAKHDYFVDLLRQASADMPELAVLADALADPDTLQHIRDALTQQKAKPADKVTLGFRRPLPVETDGWHDWWRRFRQTLRASEGQALGMPDFATGELVQPAPTHPKITGLSDVGGSSMGSTLISFDKPAFESYGLTQSANCALSEQSAASYRAALNDLIAKHSERLAGAKATYWFKERVPDEDDPIPWLSEPPSEVEAQQRARGLLRAIKQGQRPDLKRNHYYALTLSGASGRVMVRDWIEGPFEELVANVAAWFDDLSVVHRDGGNALAPEPKFLAVLAATVRDLKDLAAPFVANMWRVAVHNEPIPREALARAVQRVRVDIITDAPFNHARMGLIRAYHVRKNRKEGAVTMPMLNPDHPSAAYQCGRLMAVLAAVQRAALGDVGAGVVQRFYAAASSTPALVLGRLTRTSHFHLDKLESRGLAHWYEDKLAEIWSRLGDSVPRTLNLEEQSLFALGYYQQLADLRTKKSDKSDDSQSNNTEGEITNE